ncbi:hypothetical protein NHQ30_010219 [Ciborinia camelliae]|nr:hypothetical protein NHQ30_010219 [Ciborinia camelliae]
MFRRSGNKSSTLPPEDVLDSDSAPNLTDSDYDCLSDGAVDRELAVKDIPEQTKFDFVLLDVFTRTIGKGRRIAIIILDGETREFLLPFERELLVAKYDCPAIVLYSRGDEKSQFYIEHQFKDKAKTDWEPFDTSHGVLALNALLDFTDAGLNNRKEGRLIRQFLDGANDFSVMNYPEQHYVFMEGRREDDWFEIMPFRAGRHLAILDKTLQYRTVRMPHSAIYKAGFTEDIIKDISRSPVFVHQFGLFGFTLINLKTNHLFNRITTGMPEYLVREAVSLCKDSFTGQTAGTVFFYMSPRLSETSSHIKKSNVALFDLYQIDATIVAPFPDSPATGSAATALAAYLAMYVSEHDVQCHSTPERELNIGDLRISRFTMQFATANTAKNQESWVEIVVQTEIDSLLRAKLVDLKFGAPVTLVHRQTMGVSRECLSMESNLWKSNFKNIITRAEDNDRPENEKFPSLDDVNNEIKNIAEETGGDERAARTRKAVWGSSIFAPHDLTDLHAQGLSSFLSLSKQERAYLARLFKEGRDESTVKD